MQTPREVLDAAASRWRAKWQQAASQRALVYLTSCGTTDITQPYHSYSYLAGALRRSGHHYAVRDLAIEFWHYVISPGVIDELRRECERRIGNETGDRAHVMALFVEVLQDSERFKRAFATLRDPERFFDIASYLGALKELNLLPRLLTMLSRSATYRTFSSASPPGTETDRINLVKLRSEIKAGFGVEVLDYFYDRHADDIAAMDVALVGLTLPFLSQLEHSLFLGHRLRERGIDVAIGGPIAAKFYKYIGQVDKLKVLSFAADYLVTGEAETLICQLADAAQKGTRPGQPGKRPDNLVDLSDPRPLERYFFENVDELPTPDYGLWDYSLYASPEPGGLYSPTRGCYWNKCSFCDYGLAMNTPTSPWRTRSPSRVADDLMEASKHIRYFFFAVDVLSPSYALKLARELIERDIQLKWMADFRLEASFKVENLATIAESGCLGAAFGMESTDQTVIDLMHKGTRVDKMQHLIDAFANVGIPVQLMGFTGHPGETKEQAGTTFATAEILSRTAATVALGKFGLTPGSDIARNPEKYGIEVSYDPSGDVAIPWELSWKHRTHVDAYPEDDFRESLRLVRGFPYPFLGATSTLHSLLFFERRPKAPFPIPQWGYDLSWGQFRVIPFYIRTRSSQDHDGRIALQSGLTGRILVVSGEHADAIDAVFSAGGTAQDAWLRVDATEGIATHVQAFLDFLVEHSLAMFLPEEAL